MDTILGFLSYLLLELPARAITAFPDTPFPVIVFLVVGVVVILTRLSRPKPRKRRER